MQAPERDCDQKEQFVADLDDISNLSEAHKTDSKALADLVKAQLAASKPLPPFHFLVERRRPCRLTEGSVRCTNRPLKPETEFFVMDLPPDL